MKVTLVTWEFAHGESAARHPNTTLTSMAPFTNVKGKININIPVLLCYVHIS